MKRIRIALVAATALFALMSGARAIDTLEFDLATSSQDNARFNQLNLQQINERLRIHTLREEIERVKYPHIYGTRDQPPPSVFSKQGSGLFGKQGGRFRTGLSAGGSARNPAVWGSYSYNNFSDSHPSTKMDGDTHAFFLGIDDEIFRNLIAGLSIGVSLTDTTSPVNGGKSGSTGVTIAPYFLYLIDKNFDVDLSFGGTFTNNDNERMVGGTVVTSDSNSLTSFISTHANYARWVGLWKFSTSAGATFSNTRSDGYFDSLRTVVPGLTTKLGTFDVGGRVLYYWKSVQPYVKARFEYDFRRTKVLVGAGQAVPPNDRTGFVVGGGMNFTLAKNITGGVGGDVVLGRQNFDSYTISANVRWAFGGVK